VCVICGNHDALNSCGKTCLSFISVVKYSTYSSFISPCSPLVPRPVPVPAMSLALSLSLPCPSLFLSSSLSLPPSQNLYSQKNMTRHYRGEITAKPNIYKVFFSLFFFFSFFSFFFFFPLLSSFFLFTNFYILFYFILFFFFSCKKGKWAFGTNFKRIFSGLLV
jgi:hypothetical protein